ncbi:MAG: energy transducer TonB [Thiohalophilus sp.]|jgi:protein TonB
MKLYQAIIVSLLAHGILLLPSAGPPLPEIKIAPMQVTLLAGETQSEKNKQHHQNLHETKPMTSREKLQSHSLVSGSHNQREADAQDTPPEQELKLAANRTGDTLTVMQTPRTASSKLSRQKAQTRVVSRLHHELKNYFEYPMLARRNGWEGKVVLAMDIYVDGRIYNVQLKSGSGYRILDRSALNAVSRIHTLPNVPQWHGSSPLNIALPVIFRLQG